MSRPVIVLVAAVAENGVIGRHNGLVWRLKSDLRRFREITWGKPLVMGRKTFESIGKPLPGRDTIVLTRDPAFAMEEGVRVAHDWPQAKRLADEIAIRAGVGEIVIAGGAEIYRLALPEADALRLTLVHATPAGDAVFPEYDPGVFEDVRRESHPAGPGDEHPFTFLDLRRRAPGPQA